MYPLAGSLTFDADGGGVECEETVGAFICERFIFTMRKPFGKGCAGSKESIRFQEATMAARCGVCSSSTRMNISLML
jgi:hypothetical protein